MTMSPDEKKQFEQSLLAKSVPELKQLFNKYAAEMDGCFTPDALRAAATEKHGIIEKRLKTLGG